MYTRSPDSGAMLSQIIVMSKRRLKRTAGRQRFTDVTTCKFPLFARAPLMLSIRQKYMSASIECIGRTWRSRAMALTMAYGCKLQGDQCFVDIFAWLLLFMRVTEVRWSFYTVNDNRLLLISISERLVPPLSLGLIVQAAA